MGHKTESGMVISTEQLESHNKRDHPVKWFKRIGLGIILLFILALAVEPVLSAYGADNFFTLAAIPVGNTQKSVVNIYQEVLGENEVYALVKNYRGEEIFKHPAAAFAKTEKECAPLLEAMQKEKHLPAFSTKTYRKYLFVLGEPPAYPGQDDSQIKKVFYTGWAYLNSTQLLFGPQKSLMDSSK